MLKTLYLYRDTRTDLVYHQVVGKTRHNYKKGDTLDVKLELQDQNGEVRNEWVIGKVINRINNIIIFEIIRLC